MRLGSSMVKAVGALENLEHRPVLVFEQALSYPHLVIRGDADEVLIEGPMVDRAEAEPVAHHRLAPFVSVADDVRRVEEPASSLRRQIAHWS